MTESPRILVVDDLPQNVRLLEAILTPRGYHVVAANSGASGGAELSHERFRRQ